MQYDDTETLCLWSIMTTDTVCLWSIMTTLYAPQF